MPEFHTWERFGKLGREGQGFRRAAASQVAGYLSNLKEYNYLLTLPWGVIQITAR